MRFADLDCVTVDCYGTLLELENPVVELSERLREQGVSRSADEVGAALDAEIEFYKARSLEGRDPESLLALRLACCEVFLKALGLGAELDAASFLPPFLASLRFRSLDGVAERLRELRDRGLPLAVVSNWDCSLPERLEEAGLRELLEVVIASAEAGFEKPDPRIFHLALERLGAEPARSLHVGDGEIDRAGAVAAGMLFAAAPLAAAFEGWR